MRKFIFLFASVCFVGGCTGLDALSHIPSFGTHFCCGHERTENAADFVLGTPSFYIQNLNRAEKVKFRQAAEIAQDILSSEEFERQLSGKRYKRACDLPEMVDADVLLGEVRSVSAPDIYSRKLSFTGVTKAQTLQNPPRIAINPSQITGPTADLVGTIVHELTHLVASPPSDSLQPKYRDRGHGPNCPQSSLASYELGNEAIKFYEATR